MYLLPPPPPSVHLHWSNSEEWLLSEETEEVFLEIILDRIWSFCSPVQKHVLGFECCLTKSKFLSVVFQALRTLAAGHFRISSSDSRPQALRIPFRLECSPFSRCTPMLFHFMLLLITFLLPENSFPHSCNLMLCTRAFNNIPIL